MPFWGKKLTREESKRRSRLLENALSQSIEHLKREVILAEKILGGTVETDEFFSNTTSVLKIEIPYVWGWHFGYSTKNPIDGVSASEQATGYLKYYLQSFRYADEDAALDIALKQDELWNSADPVFGYISKLGEKSFGDYYTGYLANIIITELKLSLEADSHFKRDLYSSDPGANELYLLKRDASPFFTSERRIVRPEDISEARWQDEQLVARAEEKLERIGLMLKALPESTTTGDLLKLREELEELMSFSVAAGGKAKAIAVSADRLREAILLDVRSAFPQDASMMSNINAADDLFKDKRLKFNMPLVSRILRVAINTPPDEHVSDIITEDVHSIEVCLSCLDAKSAALYSAKSVQLIKGVSDQGYIGARLEQKLDIFIKYMNE